MTLLTVSDIRRLLGLPPLIAAGNDYVEWEHPRDKNGQWIEKLSHVRFGEGWGGVIESMNRDGSVTVRVTHSPDPARINTRVSADPKTIETIDAKAYLEEQQVTPPTHEGRAPFQPRAPIMMNAPKDFESWQEMKDWLTDKDVIVFDTETTGFDTGPGGENKVIELAGVRMRNGEVIDEFHSYAQADEVPEFITGITGIDASKTADAPSQPEVREAFLKWANVNDNTVFVAHNAPFDLGGIAGMRGESNTGLPSDVPVIDTVSLARSLMPKDDAPVQNHKLGTLTEYFGVGHQDAHTASSDTRAIGEVLGHLLDYGISENRDPKDLMSLADRDDEYNIELARYAEELAVWRDREVPEEVAPVSKRLPRKMRVMTPEERRKFKVPKGWKNVMYNELYSNNDTNLSDEEYNGFIGVGEDARGNPQYKYDDRHRRIKDSLKFEATRTTIENLPKIGEIVRRDMGVNDSASALALQLLLGMRVGGKTTKVKKNDKEAFGAANLQARHVKLEDDGSVTLTFTGKKGVSIKLNTHEPIIREMMEDKLKTKSGTDDLFDTNDSRVRAYFTKLQKEIGISGLKTHNLRHAFATTTARSILTQYPKPTTQAEYMKVRKLVAERVSDLLGNNADEALKSYIDPKVWEEWVGTENIGWVT